MGLNSASGAVAIKVTWYVQWTIDVHLCQQPPQKVIHVTTHPAASGADSLTAETYNLLVWHKVQ